MKKTCPFFNNKIFLPLISLISFISFSQTEKQVKEIVKNYDMVKANLLFNTVKQREDLQKKEVLNFAKANNLPLFKKKRIRKL